MGKKILLGIAFFVVGIGMSTLPMFLPTAEAVETITIIPYLDTNYKFKVVGFGGLQGFELPTFDDSSFSTGDAGFGTQTGCPLNNSDDAKTPWRLFTDILLRKNFNLPAGATNLRVFVAIDNDIQVFVNGLDISGGFRSHEGCPTRDSFVFTAPDIILNEGENLLSVRARDRGIVNYVDVRVVVDVFIVTIDIDIKPGSDSNSVNCKSKGVIPIAIINDGSFDVTSIDIESLLINATPVLEAHNTIHVEDVDDDGDLDAVLHIRTVEFCASLPDGFPLRSPIDITMTGSNADGEFEGSDTVQIIKR